MFTSLDDGRAQQETLNRYRGMTSLVQVVTVEEGARSVVVDRLVP